MIKRVLQLMFGLSLYGFAAALTIRSDLGLSPWHVFHQGVSHLTGLSFGLVVNLTGCVLLLVWLPLRQRIGVGTIMNVLTIGTVADLSLLIIPAEASLAIRWALLGAGILLTAIASGIYIGAGLEPGPRDGLMTGIARRTGCSIRTARTGVELGVLLIGGLLGGKIGIGTLFYAFLIGPLAQFFLRVFATRPLETRDPNRRALGDEARALELERLELASLFRLDGFQGPIEPRR